MEIFRAIIMVKPVANLAAVLVEIHVFSILLGLCDFTIIDGFKHKGTTA